MEEEVINSREEIEKIRNENAEELRLAREQVYEYKQMLEEQKSTLDMLKQWKRIHTEEKERQFELEQEKAIA